MSKHTPGPWIIKRDMIYGNNGRESIACVLDGAWPHGLRPDPKANAKRIVSCVNALEGLSNDALDGGWNFKSMSKYCKDIESQRDELLEALELGRAAIGEHIAPSDCYSTGPLTGNHIEDLIVCPACRFISAYEKAIAKAKGES